MSNTPECLECFDSGKIDGRQKEEEGVIEIIDNEIKFQEHKLECGLPEREIVIEVLRKVKFKIKKLTKGSDTK